ncbi:LysR substrate-binding domain-containing protein [Paraburkholderia tropica]|uniref:LysR family transcriptional regulator n=1 Tax=Paraburkholderia tropica TaxID=92647 RepID=A0ABX5MCT9_9BURK|nr:LysR substrate-binding domain-containing protein [Paraburkholderia tropica]MBB3004695.1 LysR family glycine cleavage system transcriptional activator [Paraburkholderia tropica]MBB6323493.1 LysR family glycine cleavage system transcriptional activator [Paraburkholderia tropica]PXX05259.1 LysR family transcriptional regulator [Paraburkholderia tropica]PZW70578.1 LysR family transcriptional regulator [Paraburkholderia tropica]QNB17395.1 LysR family transcriptional regulator [Paraburkholderia t
MNTPPPLKALIAFEATMRHGSFSEAAVELHVTPGAVGQQVQKLEEWLTAPLFVRQIRQLIPTPEAKAYFLQIQPALAQIVLASHRIRESRRRGLRVTMPPSFAAKWFAPRMAAFLSENPGIALNLTTSTTLVDFDFEPVDLAVRYFDGSDADLCVTLLRADEARAYCSPRYASELALKAPADLARATLLHNTLHPHWVDWLSKFSELSPDEIESIRGIHFDQSLMAIDAALRNQGIVLTSALLVEDELANGSLVEPFVFALALRTAYYLVHPRAEAAVPAVETLKEWFLDQVEAG